MTACHLSNTIIRHLSADPVPKQPGGSGWYHYYDMKPATDTKVSNHDSIDTGRSAKKSGSSKMS